MTLWICLTLAVIVMLFPAPLQVQAKPSFRNFVDSLYPDAAAAGVEWETFEAATAGLQPNNKIIKFTKSQPEFKRSIGQYVEKRVTAARIQSGQAMAKKYARTLSAIEKKYGVDRYVLLAIWGMETNYGGYIGNSDTLRSLATLAYVGYRGDYFQKEFINALLVLQQEKLSRKHMRGSWAGAVGHTQFMPSSFLKYAVDHNGDGKRDLWGSKPDALASAANYLKGNGWKTGARWGYQVNLPKGLDLTKADDTYRNWVKRGVVRMDGGNLPDRGSATLLFPSGIEGLAFLATNNFMVLKSYNFSDAYALSVGHLADRIANRASPLAGNWNVEKPLNKAERIDMQKRMQAAGYPVPRTDGRVGLEMRAVIRDYQARNNMTPDGHADQAVYKSVKSK
ncbi:lytic murein transglycosylase [Hoeflea sp. TYP-13]|uniref:lytic murein transglycosylase n=1 Tax=Hoeflea sp. TYP-13 TaxID=3230023 RepID=UPI0034C688DD